MQSHESRNVTNFARRMAERAIMVFIVASVFCITFAMLHLIWGVSLQPENRIGDWDTRLEICRIQSAMAGAARERAIAGETVEVIVSDLFRDIDSHEFIQSHHPEEFKKEIYFGMIDDSPRQWRGWKRDGVPPPATPEKVAEDTFVICADREMWAPFLIIPEVDTFSEQRSECLRRQEFARDIAALSSRGPAAMLDAVEEHPLHGEAAGWSTWGWNAESRHRESLYAIVVNSIEGRYGLLDDPDGVAEQFLFECLRK